MRKWRIYKSTKRCGRDRDLPWRIVMPSGFVIFEARSFEDVRTAYAGRVTPDVAPWLSGSFTAYDTI
jgi:hypothetical protein